MILGGIIFRSGLILIFHFFFWRRWVYFYVYISLGVRIIITLFVWRESFNFYFGRSLTVVSLRESIFVMLHGDLIVIFPLGEGYYYISVFGGYLLLRLGIGLMSRVFISGPRDWGSISDRVIQRLKKWYLIPPCLTLSIIGKGKVEQSREWSSALLYTSV